LPKKQRTKQEHKKPESIIIKETIKMLFAHKPVSLHEI